MSKGFNYSKWDNIELSDDEDDVHPNIDRESWFRMKHRSRVEREDHELKDTNRINSEMDKANTRIKMLERDLQKIAKAKAEDSDSDDDDDDDLDDTEAIKIEMEELQDQNAQRQATLDEYEKNKKWNVDNMSEITDERTMVNKDATKVNYTKTGHAQSTVSGEQAKIEFEKARQKAEKEAAAAPANNADADADVDDSTSTSTKKKAPAPAKPAVGPAKPPTAASTSTTTTVATKTKSNTDPTEVDDDPNFLYTYHEFTEKYAGLCEQFMFLKSFDESKDFLLKHGTILLQEHAANYLLLATLEDEMNGLNKEMKQRAKQSQIVTNIAELAQSWKTHPGNAIVPFFNRCEQREFLEGFLAGVKVFMEKIEQRAVVKRKEIDAQREEDEEGEEGQHGGNRVKKEGVDLSEIPKEERLGPGGLDPLEVIDTLPQSLQDAFESRDTDNLRQALMDMDPKDAEYHMKRCVDSGLWNAA